MIEDEGAERAERRARVEAVLARYPHVGPQELESLIRWFRKDASALEVGQIASDPALAGPYRQFAETHIERLTIADLLRVLAVLAASVALFWAILR